MILNKQWREDVLDRSGMSEWRRYRIEYSFEGSGPEGIIYLPADINSRAIEAYLNHVINERR